MSRISRDIYTSLDVNGPYLRIDTQPVSTTVNHNFTATFTIAASTYYLTGDEAEIGDIDVLEADAVAPTDAGLDNQTPGVPHTAKVDGSISYQWYEISVDPIDNSETVNKLTDGLLYSGTTTSGLGVANAVSPSYHLNRYYCELDFIPTLTNGQYDTGNAVNDILKSDEVTLNVRPFIILNTQPLSDTVIINTDDDASTFTKASFSDTRFPWNNYRLQYQWWEKDTLNQGSVPNIRLVDGDFSDSINVDRVEEVLVNKIQKTTNTISVGSGDNNTIVGIPTEAVEVSVKIVGANGGGGGDEDATYGGGEKGKGRVGEFKFSDAEINYINNAGEKTDYLLIAGLSGDTGRTGNSGVGGNGGIGAQPFAVLNTISAIRGGAGGDAGPGGSSGGGGGGGSASGIVKYTYDNGRASGKWIAIAGAGGGGGGASKEASGNAGGDALEWEDFDTTTDVSPVQEATAVNYNPIAGTEQATYKQDRIDYGFYVKTSSQTSTLNTTTTYDRVVVIWNHRHVVNQSNVKLNSDSTGTYIESGNVKYYASTHRGSLLGWCNDDSQEKICLIDGGYTNSFNVFKQGKDIIEGLSAYRGANGGDKIIGDGGGGGGAGGGAHSPAVGGSVGSDPVSSDEVDIRFTAIASATYSVLKDKYIRFYETSWYGFPETEPNRQPAAEINVNVVGGFNFSAKLKPDTTYDVVSSFEGGRTSDFLRILQDLTLTGNRRDTDTIFGRTIGMNADGDEGTDEALFRDMVVSVSDGSFEYVPETVRLDDEQIVGRAIIRYTTPSSVKNSVTATGGNGGRSEYDSQILNLIDNGNYGLNDSANGRVDLTYKTEQPYNIIEEEKKTFKKETNYSVRGSSALEVSGYTSTLTMRSDYVFSKRVLAQITAWNTETDSVALTSGSDSIYTNVVDITFSDERDNTIVVEQIRHNDDFAVLSNINLKNGDLTFENSNAENEREVQYYSFYSNQDIEVDVKMYGGKGNDFGSFSGGEGGFSYLRLNMKANTEYVIAGLNEYVNTPFLFKRSSLLACVGGGGHANTLGRGAHGGGVTINGEAAPRGGTGGIAPATLSENGTLGSASISSIFPIPGDSQAPIPDGGITVRCSKGNPIPGGLSPCTNRSGNTKFKLASGTDVTNTKNISRGFKAGYNLFYTAGRNNGAVINQGWGGSGATGGTGSDEYGGGGGSGYIIPDLTTDIFARSEEQSNQDGTDPITSTLGGSTGPARVVISLAEIPSSVLPGFIERPAEPDKNIRETGGFVDFVYEPLPETISPPLADPPVPSMSITKLESTGFNSGTQTFNSPFNTKIGVLEKGQLKVHVKTQNIPAGTTFYWAITDSYADIPGRRYKLRVDFDKLSDNFTTTSSGGEVVGNFTINPTENNRTDFIEGSRNWKVTIYTDRLFEYPIAYSHAEGFNLLDTSLAAPSATFKGLLPDQTRGVRIQNSIDESASLSITASTRDIKNGETIYWKLLDSTGSPITATTTPSTTDFGSSIVSGTATVSSNFTINADGAAVWNGIGNRASSNQGSAEFVIAAKDDIITEGEESFGLQLEYPSGTVITRTVGTLVGEVKKSIKINDISIDPEASFSGDSSVNEGSNLLVTVNTVYLREGNVVYWKLFASDGTTPATTDDFDTPVEGFQTLGPTGGTDPARTGSVGILITPKNDNSTEGTEVFILKVYRDADRTDPLHAPGTINAASFSFSVIDTSLSAREYEVFTPTFMKEDGVARELTFRVKNLFRDTVVGTERDPTYYWRIYDSDDYPALGKEEINGDGYIKHFSAHEGSFKTAYKLDRAGAVPIHEKIFTVTPEKDYLTGENGDFTIKFFDDKDEFDRDGTPIYVSSTKGRGTFELQDTSKNIIKFRKEFGFAVPGTDTLESIDGYQSYNQPSDDQSLSPQINESGQFYSFRIETSAQPGTEFSYELVTNTNSYDVSDDFEEFYNDDLPTTRTRGFYNISENTDIDSNYAGLFGVLTTMARSSSENSNITVDEGIRSVAFIYVKPKADRSGRPGQDDEEGPEIFKLRVYDEVLNPDADNSSKTPVVEQQFVVVDTSKRDAPPSVDARIDVHRPANIDEPQISGPSVSGNLTSYTIESLPGAQFSIKLLPSGGTATDGELSGDGWLNYTYDGSAPEPKEDEWWSLSSSDTTKFEAPSDVGVTGITIEYKITVSNDDGNQSFTRTLRIKWTPPRQYWEAVPIFRYIRINIRAVNTTATDFRYGTPGNCVTDFSKPPRTWQTLRHVHRYCITHFGPTNLDPRTTDWRTNKNTQLSWGAKLREQMESRDINAGKPREYNIDLYRGSCTFLENMSNLQEDWKLEGLLGYAFKKTEGQDLPNFTHSLRSLYQVNEVIIDTGREYFGWPNAKDDYYVWLDEDIPSEVPASAQGNQIKVGIQEIGQYHFTIHDAQDGRFKDDSLNPGSTYGDDVRDGRIINYNSNKQSISIVYYPYPDDKGFADATTATYTINSPAYLFYSVKQRRTSASIRNNLFKMPQSGRHGWVQ